MMENQIHQSNFEPSNDKNLYNQEIKHDFNNIVNQIGNSNFTYSDSNQNYNLDVYKNINPENKIAYSLSSNLPNSELGLNNQSQATGTNSGLPQINFTSTNYHNYENEFSKSATNQYYLNKMSGYDNINPNNFYHSTNETSIYKRDLNNDNNYKYLENNSTNNTLSSQMNTENLVHSSNEIPFKTSYYKSDEFPKISNDVVQKIDLTKDLDYNPNLANTGDPYDKYKIDIDKFIKDSLDKAGLPSSGVKNNLNNNNDNNIKNDSTKIFYETNPNLERVKSEDYSEQKFSYSHPEVKMVSSEKKPAYYDKIHSNSNLPTNEKLLDNNLNEIDPNKKVYYNIGSSHNSYNPSNDNYNEVLTFKDNISNKDSLNVFNTNNPKDNIYGSNISLQNYTFENLKAEDIINNKDPYLNNNLNKSSNQQFQASEKITTIPDNKKTDNIHNINHLPVSNVKKNEDMTYTSNKNAKNNDIGKENSKAKTINKIKEIEEKKDDYLTSQSSITHKDYLSAEDFKNLQFELGRTYNKELCGEQINIISKYMEIGKVLNKMVPGILNNVNPVNRMDAFKIIVANIYDWPNEEGYFNSVICFLPSANQKEAGEIVKRMNRNNCCCTIF